MTADILRFRRPPTRALLAEQARAWETVFSAVRAEGLDPMTLEPVGDATEPVILRAVEIPQTRRGDRALIEAIGMVER